MVSGKTAKEIYDEYCVPDVLQLHLLRVAAVARMIADSWNGPNLSSDMLDRVLLLHDIGNIVKMDLHEGPSWSADQLRRYREVQSSYSAKYGTDDHLASREIARDVGLSEDDLDFMDAKVFIKNDSTLASSDFNLKVAAYADQRVAPTGVVGLLPRLREAQRRYRDKPGSSMNNPRTEMLIDCAVKIEEQIAAHLSFPVDAIDDELIAPHMHALRSYVF